MLTFDLVIAAVLLAVCSFVLGLLQRRGPTSGAIPSPGRSGSGPRHLCSFDVECPACRQVFVHDVADVVRS